MKLILKVVREDMTSHDGFKWPESGPAEPVKWDATYAAAATADATYAATAAATDREKARAAEREEGRLDRLELLGFTVR